MEEVKYIHFEELSKHTEDWGNSIIMLFRGGTPHLINMASAVSGVYWVL